MTCRMRERYEVDLQDKSVRSTHLINIDAVFRFSLRGQNVEEIPHSAAS